MIDPGTLLGFMGTMAGSQTKMDRITDRLLDMVGAGGDNVDTEELAVLRDEVADLANTWKALELELKERREILMHRVDERDALLADANKSHKTFLEALRLRKERESKLPE